MVELTGEPLHILLMEDNEAHAELVIRGMRDQQVANTIHHVTDGEKALDYLFGRGHTRIRYKIPARILSFSISASPGSMASKFSGL